MVTRLYFPTTFFNIMYSIYIMNLGLKILLFNLITGILVLNATESGAVPHQDIQFKIFPERGQLHSRVMIINPGSNRFRLNSDMVIARMKADGKPVSFQTAKLDQNITEFTLAEATPGTIEISYSGPILASSYPKVINLVNRIEPDFTELAGYVQWYPKPAGGYFNFSLEVRLPPSFKVVTNGLLIRERRKLSKWRSFGPVSDIALVAVAGLKHSRFAKENYTGDIYYQELPKSYIDSVQTNLYEAMRFYTATFGAPGSEHLVRVVYSPRPGWGYVREPLIIVSENQTLEQRQMPGGAARDFQLLAHEIAHYWWKYADHHTPDDWINEGLAEFSSLLAVEKIYSAETAALFFNDHRQRSMASQTSVAIAETENDSPDREINRYSKTTTLFDRTRSLYGMDKMENLMCTLYFRFAETGQANTPLFLETVKKILGQEAEILFTECLYEERGTIRETLTKIFCNQIEAQYLGNWSGTLTQAGQDFGVELVLLCEGGVLRPFLNSPDQAVYDIPVSDLLIANGVFNFSVPAAAAAFRGSLKPADPRTVTGQWLQFGSSFPLVLKKKHDSY